jgi:acylphosphatase
VFVSGRVQGVFFRSQTKHNADRNNVNGWVRNLPDGRLEAVFEGEEDSVRALVEYCHHGPSAARVENVAVTWENFVGEFTNFKIR